MEEAEKAYAYMRNHKYFRMWQREGLMMVMEYASAAGILPTYNFKDATFPRVDQHQRRDDARQLQDRRQRLLRLRHELRQHLPGRSRAATSARSPRGRSTSPAPCSARTSASDNYAAVLHAYQLCDELGIDTISTGSLVGAVIEGYEKGILSLDDLDGQPITWGDDAAIIELIHKIARREGHRRHPGRRLPRRHRAAGRKWTSSSSRSRAWSKAPTTAGPPRAWPWPTPPATSAPITPGRGPSPRKSSKATNWTDEERVDLVIYHQSLRPLFDMLGVCRLPWIELGLNEQHYAAFYSA